jgi:hypothetical protein
MKALLLPVLFLGSLTVLGQQSPDCEVKTIKVYSSILMRGGNPCYKPSGDTIAYQKSILNLETFILSTEIFLSDTAMTLAHCLTCDTTTLPPAIRHDKYKGNPEYHPDGGYIIFTAENENGAHEPWNLPGAGVDHDIFIMIMTSTGNSYWRLTNIPAGHGILHPAFSHDGSKLFWSQMYYSTPFPEQGEEYGLWDLRMADFEVVAGIPQLSNTVIFSPRDSVWYESHAFSADDQMIAFTSHEEDSSAIYGDITVMNVSEIGSSNFTNLTNTPFIHDEHAHWSPDGNKISWMSGSFVGGLGTYSSELHLMDTDGTSQVQLTHFTEPGYPEYIQDTVVTADHYWSPDGRRIFGFIHFLDNTGWPSELYQLEFMGPCGWNATDAVPSLSAEQKGVNVYPNPASDHFNVSFPSSAKGSTRIDILNMHGDLVWHAEPANHTGLIQEDKSTLLPGAYIVHVFADGIVRSPQLLIIVEK